jgi:hypothetical protein
MSDFLTRLVQRQLGAIKTVEPGLPEVYAPFSSIEPLPLVDAPATEFTAPAVAAPPRPSLASASIKISAALQPPVRQPERTLNTKVAPRAETMSAQKSAPNPIAAPVSLEATRLVMPESSEPRRNIETASIARADNFQRQSPPIVQLSRAADETGVPLTPPRLAATSRDGVGAAQTRRQQATTEPPVHVTIGRIEVTALTQAAPAKRVSAPRKPAMSLEDYLARRQRGER